ncbi:MAG: matrixin family metalloprotease [Alphaproteobacteria bacterium]|nr:matrixin family metalloprotease [Alphaproteobacteria bacterium]
MASSVRFNQTSTYVDGILGGSMWDVPDDGTITWAVQDSDSFSWGNNVTDFNEINRIFAEYDEVIDVDFSYAGWFTADSEKPADIVIIFDNLSQQGFSSQVAGYARFPGTTEEGTVKLNLESGIQNNLSPGQSGYHVVIHEIGHALGLTHPHDGGLWNWPTFSDLGISAQNSLYTTVMSYEPPAYSWTYGWATTPMMWDVYALQLLYGSEDETRSGNEKYYLLDDNMANVIWDSGGNDTLSAENSVFKNWVDLRQGYWSVGSPDTGVLDVTGIAYNTVIENAVGSSQNDTIVGNSTDNHIVGGLGNDLISGEQGNDSLFGGGGDDVIHGTYGNDAIDGGEGKDILTYATSSAKKNINLTTNLAIDDTTTDTISNIEWVIGTAYADTIIGNNHNNTLHGGAGDDQLLGNPGNDVINGNEGNNTINGGEGIDVISFSSAPNSVEVNLSSGTALSNIYTNIISNFEWVAGSNYQDHIIGDENSNRLEGGGGNDTIDGGAGTDTVSFSGLISEYSAVESGYSIIISDGTDSRDGIDTLTSIEAFSFAGTSAVLSDLLNPSDIDNGVYRFFNLGTGTHFYSASPVERNHIINNYDQFNYEGASFKSAGAASENTAGVHRFFNTEVGTHLFTMSEVEKFHIMGNIPVFNYEGIEYQAYTSEVDGSIALYRFFNTVNGAHFFTPSAIERDSVIENLPVYNYEGIAFYVDTVV